MIPYLHAPHLVNPTVRAATPVLSGFGGTTTSFVFGLTGLTKNVIYTCQLLLGTVVQTVSSVSYTGSAATVTSGNNTISINVPAGTGTASVLAITVVSPIRTTGTYSLKVTPRTGTATTITLHYHTAFGWSLTSPTTVTGNELITGSLVINGSVVSVQDIIIGGRSILQIING